MTVRNIPVIKSYSNSYDGLGDYSKTIKSRADKLQENSQLSHENDVKRTFQNNIINEEIREATIDRLSEKAYKEGTELAFLSRLCETYINSLVVDDYFVQENRATISNYFIQTLKESVNSDITGLMESIKGNSEYLSNLVEACKKAGKKASKNVAEACKKEKTQELDEIFDQEMEKIKAEACKTQEEVDFEDKEVSDIVKDKVVSVIKAEEENNAKKKELIDDITNANGVYNENVKLIKNEHVENHTLFNSIMIKQYKDCIKAVNEGAEVGAYATLSESGNVQVNMDYIMFDTILEYTKIELLNTIRITDLKAKQLKEMAYNYAYVTK